MHAVQTFGIDSSGYRAARPTYPRAVFAWLAQLAPSLDRAWDCATGNGQAAVALAEHFARVDATDASAEQLAHAAPHPRVHYAVAPADRSGLPDGAIDLVTIAQAMHWFADDAFFAEVARVARPGGVIAAIGYGFLRVGDAIDRAVEQHVLDPVAPYWAPQARLLWNGYRDVRWPFTDVPDLPVFDMHHVWTLEQLIAYFKTWSAWKLYVEAHGADVEAQARTAIGAAWGDASTPRTVTLDFVLRVART